MVNTCCTYFNRSWLQEELSHQTNQRIFLFLSRFLKISEFIKINWKTVKQARMSFGISRRVRYGTNGWCLEDAKREDAPRRYLGRTRESVWGAAT